MGYPVGSRGHTGSVKAHPSSQRRRRGRRDGGLRGPVMSAARTPAFTGGPSRGPGGHRRAGRFAGWLRA